MLRRLAIALATALIAAAPAHASGASAEKAKPNKDVGQYVDLSPVGLPIVANRQLVNYVFVYVRINLNSSVNPSKWREREPYFRDALVRASHRTPFTIAGDYQTLDEAKLAAALHREAVALTGPGVVKSVVVTSQAPRWRRSVPRPQVAERH